MSNILSYSLIISLFLLISLLGLYRELNQGALN